MTTDVEFHSVSGEIRWTFMSSKQWKDVNAVAFVDTATHILASGGIITH